MQSEGTVKTIHGVSSDYYLLSIFFSKCDHHLSWNRRLVLQLRERGKCYVIDSYFIAAYEA